MNKLPEFFELLWLNLVVKKRNFVEFLHVILLYYRNISFMKVDLKLIFSYFLSSPYKISRKFLIKNQEEDIYAYGETPLTSLDHIVKECSVVPKDTIYELGCGRGRTCFWLYYFVGCEVVGIEYIPQFVMQARKIQQASHVEGVEFRLQDMFEANFNRATVIYLYGTCLSEESIQRLIKSFRKLSKGTKIITVSYSLNEFLDQPLFTDIKSFETTFTWGTGRVYLQRV